MKNLFKKKLFLLGLFFEIIYLSVIILEKFFPLILGKKILLYSFFIFSSLFFLIILGKKIKIADDKKTLKTIILFFVFFSLTLLISSPLGPGDVYNYIYRAKIFTQYRQNPFLVAPINFPDNQLLNYVSHLGSSTPTIYGPLWMIISFIPSFVAGNNLFVNLLLFKIIAVIFNFGCFLIIFKIINLLNYNNKNLILLSYAWNPLILFQVVNEGHNDVVMIFFLLLAIFFLLKNYRNIVLPTLILSVLIKYVTLLLLPLFFIFLIKKNSEGIKQKMSFFLIQLIIIASMVIVLFFPFWKGFITLKGLYFQSVSASLYHLSLFPFLFSLFNKEAALIRFFSYLFFGLVYFIIIFVKKTDDEKKLIKYTFWILTFYLLIASLWFQVWYLIWLIPLGIIINDTKYLKSMVLLSIFGMIHQGYNLFFLVQNFFGRLFFNKL